MTQLTFGPKRRQVIVACWHRHLYGGGGRHHGPVMVVLETDALVLSGGEDGARHHLCSLLDLIQQRVCACWDAETYNKFTHR